jgi:hypothetical protein
MIVSVVGLRLCVVGDGFHILHLNMLSWLGCGRCVRVLRVLRRECVVRDVSGGCMMCSLWVVDVCYVVGGSLCEVVALCRRAFWVGSKLESGG